MKKILLSILFLFVVSECHADPNAWWGTRISTLRDVDNSTLVEDKQFLRFSDTLEKWEYVFLADEDITDLDHSVLDNLEWSLAGHTIDTTVDMVGNNIDNGGTITAEQLTSTDDAHIADRLGVGTTSPDTRLHVKADNSTSVIRTERNQASISSSDILARWEVETQDTTDPGICASIEALSYGASGETGWRFKTGVPSALVESMQITSDGDVGIGTPFPDSPSALFHLKASTAAEQKFTNSSTTPTTDTILGRIEFETKDTDSSGTSAVIQAIIEGSAGETALAFETGTPGTLTERMRLDNGGNLLFVGDSSGLPYGSMYNHDDTTKVTIGAINTAVRIPSGFTEGQLNLTTFGNAREITVIKAGRYLVNWSISFTTDGNGKEIEGCVMIDGAADTTITAHRRIGTATDTGAIGGTGILDLTANQVLSLAVLNETAGGDLDVNIEHANMSLLHVGGS